MPVHVGLPAAIAAAVAAATLCVAEPGSCVDTQSPVRVPGDQIAWQALVPAQPDGPAIAILEGDPDRSASSMLLRIPRMAGRLHRHTAGYRLVVLEGRMRHWSAGEREGQTPILGPGSYWFQPGGEAHADSCLSESCVVFVRWDGARDVELVPAP